MKINKSLFTILVLSLFLVQMQCVSTQPHPNQPVNNTTRWNSTGNVKLYGAVGDGKTNDTEAFQKAIDDVVMVNNNGQTKTFSQIVYIPCGVYLIDELKIGIGVTLQGEGQNCVELVLNKNNGTLIKTRKEAIDNQYIKIRNVTLRGNGTGVGVDLTYANFDSHIKECVINDFKTNIRLESCWDFFIDDCHIDDAKGNNIEAYNITASTISNCRIDDAGEHNIYISESKIGTGATANVSLTNNAIQRAKKTGITFNKVLLPKIENCFIEGNNILGGYPFVDVIGNTKGTQMLAITECYFTTAKTSAPNTIAINIANKTKIANINNTYFDRRLVKDVQATSNLKSLIMTACQNNVKTPLNGLDHKTKLQTTGNHYNQEDAIPTHRKTEKNKSSTETKGYREGKGSPVGKVAPTSIGEEYLDTNTGDWYKSSFMNKNGWRKLN